MHSLAFVMKPVSKSADPVSHPAKFNGVVRDPFA